MEVVSILRVFSEYSKQVNKFSLQDTIYNVNTKVHEEAFSAIEVDYSSGDIRKIAAQVMPTVERLLIGRR